MPNKQMLISAATKFINKVETGRARSTETYNELKAALQAEDVSSQLKPPVSQENGGQNEKVFEELYILFKDYEFYRLNTYSFSEKETAKSKNMAVAVKQKIIEKISRFSG